MCIKKYNKLHSIIYRKIIKLNVTSNYPFDA